LTDEVPIALVKKDKAITKPAMIKAGMAVLGGFKLDIEVEEFIYPDRFVDKDGKELWVIVEGALNQITSRKCSYDTTRTSRQNQGRCKSLG